MNFITLKELKKMVPVASEFKRVPGLKKILEDGIEVILRKQMENHAEVVVYKNGYVSYHALRSLKAKKQEQPAQEQPKPQKSKKRGDIEL